MVLTRPERASIIGVRLLFFTTPLFEGIVMKSVSSRTFKVAYCPLYETPEQTYVGFDRNIDFPSRIAIVRNGPVESSIWDDIFALDWSMGDPLVYDNSIKELVRYCENEGGRIVGFYDSVTPFEGSRHLRAK